MKKKITYILLWLCLFYNTLAFAQKEKFFKQGQVLMKGKVEKINLTYDSFGWAFVNVMIGGKRYHFLFDTGAPTIISSEIYKALSLKPIEVSEVTDSQDVNEDELSTLLPEMKVDGVTFKNIACIVVDLNLPEFKCFHIDGILGANQMSKLFWKIDYRNREAEVTQDLSNFKDLSSYSIRLPFVTSKQGTPYMAVKFSDLPAVKTFTFDTGSAGGLNLSNDDLDFVFQCMEQKSGIKAYGVNSLGAFGESENQENYIFKTSHFQVSGYDFGGQWIKTDKTNIIGNAFLSHFAFVMDWKHQVMYLKKLKNTDPVFQSFGFSYRFVDGQAKVIDVFEDPDQVLQLGDILLRVNAINLENLSPAQECEIFSSRIEEKFTEMEVQINRNGTPYTFHLKKKTYIE